MANPTESYVATQVDNRTLGVLLGRIIDEINRPDLQSQALNYVQDAIRYYQSKPWLFNETDNVAIQTYANNTIYPQGATIQASINGILYAVVALNFGTSGPSGTPAFSTTVFTVPATYQLPPPAPGTPGTVVDNGITWATAGLWSSVNWTQLSTVYYVNQYVPFFGYQTPDLFEITTANLRLGLEWVDYATLRAYDVIQPPPITAYPRFGTWYQQQLYIWPYPNGFFPITISGRWSPPMIGDVTKSNFWTTVAERMIRKWAASMMDYEITRDREAAEISETQYLKEERRLRSQAIQQRSPISSGIPASEW